MVLQVETNYQQFEIGEYIAFITGKDSVNTNPRYLRIGQVESIDTSGVVYKVRELGTNKLWNPYSSDAIKAHEGIKINNVKATLIFSE